MFKITKLLLFCAIIFLSFNDTHCASYPRISNPDGSKANYQSKYVDPSDKDQIMNEYTQQLKNQIQGVMGVDVGNFECDLMALILLTADLIASFIGMSNVVSGPVALAAFTALVLGSANDIACWWSVVRNPVEVFPEENNANSVQKQNSGRYKKAILTPAGGTSIVYGATDNYDEAVRATSSEYLTICQRFPFPYKFLDPSDLTEEEKVLKPNSALQWLLKRSGDLQCVKGKAGDTVTINTTKFAIYQIGNNICAKITSALGIPFSWPQNNVGCHKTPIGGVAAMCASSIPITDKNNTIIAYDNTPCYSCYIAKSCYDKRYQIAHSPLPIASSLVQCFLETLSVIISGGSNSGSMSHCSAGGLLYNVQKKLFQTLQALISLSLILYGIKIMLGQEGPKKQDVISMILKIALILYFTTPNGGGMRQYYQYLQDITVGLGDMLLSSAGNTSVCNYGPNDYITSISTGNANTKKVISIPQLALWDRLDCRLFFYLGAPAIVLSPATHAAAERGEQHVGVSKKFLFIIMILPAFLTGQFLVLIAGLVIAVVVFAMIVWALQIYLLSALAMAVVVVVSPLFIPMALFQYTKTFFDNWLKELIAYTLYPALLMGYLGFFFTVIDDIYFGKIEFSRLTTDKSSGGITKTEINFVLLDNNPNNAQYLNDDDDTNADAPLVLGLASGLSVNTQIVAAFMPIAMLGAVAIRVIYPMLKMALALLMFMFFNKIIVTIVGELSGGSRSAIELGGSAQDPLKTVKKVAEIGAKAAKKGVELAKKGKQALSKTNKGGGSKGGDSGSKISKVKR